MIGQDRGQRRDIGQQPLDRALGQRGEGLVGRREDGERPVPAQRLFQTRGLNGGNERGEVPRRNGGIDDIGRLMAAGQRRGADQGEEAGGGKSRAKHVVSPFCSAPAVRGNEGRYGRPRERMTWELEKSPGEGP